MNANYGTCSIDFGFGVDVGYNTHKTANRRQKLGSYRLATATANPAI